MYDLTCVPSEPEPHKCIECELVIVACVVSLFFSKEILVQDHFYRKYYLLSHKFFELDNCLSSLRMTCPLPSVGSV